MTILRFIVGVDAAWNVTFQCPSRPAFSTPPRSMTRAWVGAGAKKRAYPERSPGLSALETSERQRRITNREPKDGDVEELGVHLFDALIGAQAWADIQKEAPATSLIELALSFPSDDGDLARLHWELMHAPGEFLLGSSGRRVAITRLIRSPVERQPKIPSPPRILLVVGAKLSDSSIRPAAECIAVLQETATNHRTGRTEVLLDATKRSLEALLSQVRPHVVHFVCHGSTSGGETVLELGAENGDDGALTAAQLLDLFNQAKHTPELVVLSACYSASPGGPAFASGEPTAPFAVELVRGGIPVVIGMAGRVADSACRLFARRFCEALVDCDSIVAATQQGRSAAFVGNANPTKNIDWVFPIILLGEHVSPEFAVEADDSGSSTCISALERELGIGELRPVFCGRFEELAAFRSLLGSRQPKGAARDIKPVMAIYSDGPGDRQAGKTWLLKEMMSRCLAGGHLPCPVLSEGSEPPRTILDIARRIGSVILKTREQLGLEPAKDAQIQLLQKTPEQVIAAPLVDTWIKSSLEMDPTISTRVVKLAVQYDLKRLRNDAVSKHPGRFREDAKVVLFLDDIHGVAELGALLSDFLDLGGLDARGDQIRVVLAFRYETPTKETLRPIVETRNGVWYVRKLSTFGADGEDLFSYQRLLMNPFKEVAHQPLTKERLTFDFGAPRASDYETVFRQWLGSKLPGALIRDPELYVCASMGRISEFVVPADDAAVLDNIRKRWP